MVPEVATEELGEALDDCVEQLLWEAGIVEPPVDAFLVAMRLGILVAEDDELENRAQFVRVAGGHATTPTPLIVVADEARYERRQFAVAHELGEFAAARVFDQLGIHPRHAPVGTREQIANALAGRILVPMRWLRAHGLEWDWDLPHLKQFFQTASHELLARRMLDMRPRIMVTLFDLGHALWRRNNFGGLASSFLTAEWRAWQQCHATGLATSASGIETEAGEATVRCWAIHEPDWKREIMRTEFLDWY